ncbi:MAG: Zn-dependent alcohol dehydrogenase [Burkholderiales bacterium]
MEFGAAILTAVGAPLRIERVTLGKLGPSDVLIRTRASGLCHTDLEVMTGDLPYPLPIVLGHEGAGVVEAVGGSVTRVVPGDHVVASWNPHCGHCFYCERNLPILCEPSNQHQLAGTMLDGQTKLFWRGERLHHFSHVSGFAEYLIVPESGAIAVPREMPFDRACLLGCGVMTGYGAVSRIAKVEAGSSVVVVGCGIVGLNVLQAAQLEGAARIIAIDRDPIKLALARQFGATDAQLASDGTIADVKAITEGRGADYVFEAAGSEASIQLALELARPGGRVVILGKTEANRKIGVRFGSLVGEKRIVRSSYGGARPRTDFPWMAQLYLNGKLKLDELITSRLALDQINDGFDAMRRGTGLRCVVTFDA